ncbi:hypothetical protein [Lonepinella sp. BR2474]|uniref:hypothetical protein n=1 Tax=Lonepinella sp. BR2474 TaxID=3434548 RepID=UPI003F6DC935
MNFKTIKKFALAVSISLALAGCQAGGASSESELEQAYGKNGGDTSFFSNSTVQACAVGALGGAVVGALACLNKNPAVCAAIGAVAGCGVGAGADKYFEVQKEQYKNKEDRINADIADVRKDTQQVQKLTAATKSVLSRNNQELAQLKKDLKNNKIKQADAQQQLAKIDANIAYAKKQLSGMQNKQQQWEELAKKEKMEGAKTAKLDAEIKKLQKDIKSYETLIASTSTQRSALG